MTLLSSISRGTRRSARLLFLALFLLGFLPTASADVVCRNPVIWADVPDPDVIRVGDTFYLTSTTMHLMPGAPIMTSKNLVQWNTVGYIFDKLTDSPKYDMQGGTVYGRGQWATSLRYHNGMFYALFAPNDNPGGQSYVYKTTDPAKGWTLVSRLPHFHDASLFFDDDGRVYVFHGTGNLTELSADLKSVKAGGMSKTLFQRDSTKTGLLEGSRVIKHDGKYYLLMISWPNGGARRQVCYRADSLNGTWEKRVILKDNFAGFPYVGQGTIVDDNHGNWYGIIFQDRGGVGRVLTLEPCRWIDGWPMLGDEQGRVPQTWTVPLPGDDKAEGVAASDDFSGKKLKLVWEWNHNPVDKAWSLAERPGWLRLRTANVTDNLFAARNTISQRLMGPVSTVTVKMDLKAMRNGDRAGLAAFQGDAAMLMLSKDKGRTTLSLNKQSVSLDEKDKKIIEVKQSNEQAMPWHSSIVYLRMVTDFRLNRDLATFFYSQDGHTWHQLGEPFHMVYDFRRLFMGTRAAIFNYATEQLGGRVDVDYYTIKVSEKPEE